MTLPRISNYGQGRTERGNTLCASVGNLTVYYSYTTPVAFDFCGSLTVRRNQWGPTTGKHLNWIDGGKKDARIDGAEFERRLQEISGGI